MLRIENVTKVYPNGLRANDDISLEVAAGHVFGLLGHNGAGKTTLINQVIGLAKPTSGTIRIDGQDAVAHPAMARRACSLQPQTHAPLDGLSPRQGIELMARIRGAGRRRARQRTSQLLAALDIEEWADTVSDRLSGGVRRLTAFGMAAAEPGKVVMLDEPTNDVDPVRRRALWEQVRVLADEGSAVLLVTHNVVEGERAVDSLVILDNGVVIARGTPAELRGDRSGQLRLEITALDAAAARDAAADYAGAEPAVLNGRRAAIPIAGADASAAIEWAQDLVARGRIEQFQLTPVSLEDVYVRLTSGDRNQDGTDDARLVA